MYRHPKLVCLAWPMHRFFESNVVTAYQMSNRSQAVVDYLSRTLEELRIDYTFSRSGERQTDSSTDPSASRKCLFPRLCVRFIAENPKVIELAEGDSSKTLQQR